MISSNYLTAILAIVHKQANNHFVHIWLVVLVRSRHHQRQQRTWTTRIVQLHHSASSNLLEPRILNSTRMSTSRSLTPCSWIWNVLILKRICDRRYIVYDTAQVVQGFLLKIRLA